MDEKKILLNTAACLKYLSKGKNPVTKQDIPENDTVRNPAIAKYLSFAADKIKEILDSMENETAPDSGTIVPESAETENITHNANERIVCDESGEALRIGQINKIFNRDVKPKSDGYIDSGTLLGWLTYNGFIERSENGRDYIATEKGMEAGIFPQESSKGGISLYYTPTAQQMIYDNENSIREYFDEYGDKRKPFFIDDNKKSQLRAGDDTTTISDIANYLSSFADTENYKPIQACVINKWLASKNMIFKNDSKRYFATVNGKSFGFKNIRVNNNKYGRLLYTSQAWQYIIDNIDEIIKYNREV